MLMKSLVVAFVVISPLLGQPASAQPASTQPASTRDIAAASRKDTPVTAVAGVSWLEHLHRTFDQTSMGKTWLLGPPATTPGEHSTGWQIGISPDFAAHTRTLHGSDVYRLNCQGCHTDSGLGAPPEINSIIEPVRSTSVAIIRERMKKRGMDISRADAAVLANQSNDALFQRFHKGGQDMPAFPHLSEADIRSLLAFLKLMAGFPGAEKQQVAVDESAFRVGEHIVKSTCHICHSAAGPNPTPEQISQGAIPPLSTLTARASLPEFVRKVTSGAPIMMGSPASACRGRMPVFGYLSEDEAADAYLYLTLYPPRP
jgi:mono/diheme cytochrome c family protein